MTTARPDVLELVADGLETTSFAADFLGVARSTVYKWMETGQLAYVKLGRARRIPKRALMELAAANLRGGWRRDGAAEASAR